jgi:peptidyl-tRNA hydrolase, PTH1 family
MYIVAGLGNPGKQYEQSRHNVGFMAVDKCGALDIPHTKFVKPQTFMNKSGDALKNANPKKLIVIHDDIDLRLGTIRVSKNSGSAGHKGIESIIKTLKTKDFVRIRIGIQPKSGKPKHVEDFVIKNFTKTEGSLLKKALLNARTALEIILAGNLDQAMNEFNHFRHALR